MNSDIKSVKKTETNKKIQSLVEIVIENDYNTKSREFNKIISLLYPKIKGYINSKIYDIDEVDDLTSLTFEKICSSIRTYRTEFMFVTWVYSIAKYTISEYKRNIATSKISIVSLDSIDGEATYDQDNTPFKSYGDNRYSNILVNSIKSFDCDFNIDRNNLGEIYQVLLTIEDSLEKSVFIHHYINGIMIKPIAEFYNLSENTIKTKLRNYRLMLNKKIKCNHICLSNVLIKN
jgi:RNA polymerase sigma factor (sigma-70 family)